MYDTDISSPSVPGTTVIWQDDDGKVHATQDSLDACSTFDSLPDAVDHAFADGAHAIVREGTYRYQGSIYLPSKTHIHFENAALEPVGCHGLHFGDGTTDHVFNHVSGTVEIDPDAGDTPAQTCVLVDGGTKLMSWTARADLRSGASDACLRFEGGEQGTWWNNFTNMRIAGRVVKDSTGSRPANDQRFTDCTFTGDIDVLSGNSLSIQNSALETMTLTAEAEADIHARIEACTLNVAAKTQVTIRPIRSQNNERNFAEPSFVDWTGNGALARQRGQDRDNATLQTLTQHGAYTVPDEAVLQLVNTYESSGTNNLLRAVAAGRGDGYFLQGVDNDGSVDKEVEVEGDYRNETPGKGFVVQSEHDDCRYRLTVDENGEPTTEKLDNA